MTRKRISEEDILNILRQIELDLAAGGTVEAAIRTTGISDATYYKWRKMYGGMGKSKLHEFKEMEKENTRLKRIVAELEPDRAGMVVGQAKAELDLEDDIAGAVRIDPVQIGFGDTAFDGVAAP